MRILIVAFCLFSFHISLNASDRDLVNELNSSTVIDGCAQWQPASFTATYDPLNCCWSFQNTTVNDCMQWNCTWDFGDGSPLVTTPQGVGTACHSYMYPGTYTVTLIFDSSPCHGGSGGICYGTQDVTIPPLAITSTISDYNGYNISCQGANDGWITLGSSVGYTFEWQTTPPQYTNSISNLSAGTYVCNVGFNGCVDIFSVTLTEPDIQMNEDVSPTCYGLTDGDIILNTTGGLAPYTYIWNTGDTLSYLSDLDTGTYSVQVIDSYGCIDSATYIITEATQLSSQYIASDYNGYNISCYGYNDGFIDLSLSGSVPPYYASWSSGQNTLDIYNLYAGTYNVDIVDENGCEDSLEIILYEPPSILSNITPTVNYNGYDISCNGYNDGFIDLTVTGAYPPFTYIWNTGQTTQDLDSLIAGNYSVNIYDYNGCLHIDDITLIEPTILFNTIASVHDYNGYQISCYNMSDGAIDLSVYGSVSPYNYQWNYNNIITQDLNNIPTGMYLVDIVDQNGCFISDSIFLNQPTPITSSYSVPVINGYNVTCNGGQDGSIDLSVNGSVPPYNFQWSNGYQTEDLQSLSAGVYYYTAIDQNGCITGDSVIISEPALYIQEAINNVSCFGGIDGSVSVSVSGSTPPYYVFWNNNIDTSLLEAGVYYYQIIDSIGCVYPDSLIVEEPLDILVTQNINHISCYGNSDGSVSLNISGGTAPYNIDWFGFATNNMSAGTYNFTVTDTNQCTYSEISIINEPNPIDITYTLTFPDCPNSFNGSITTSIVGGTAPYTEDWYGYNPTALGVGMYDLLITDINGCQDSNSINLVSRSNMVVSESVEHVSCEGFCDGLTDLQVSEGIWPYSVNWFGVNSDSLCVGIHYYEIIDSLGCVYSDSVNITSPDSIYINITQNGNTLTAIATGGVPPYNFSWFNSVNQLSNTADQQITYIGEYYCVAYDIQHCQSDTAYFTNSLLSVNDFIDDLLIYPNPSDGMINIEFSSLSDMDFSISLVDLLGKENMIDNQESFSGNYVKKVDLSSKSDGIYFLQIKTLTGIINTKIIIH